MQTSGVPIAVKPPTRIILLGLKNVDQVLLAGEQIGPRAPTHVVIGQHFEMLQRHIAVARPVFADRGEFTQDQLDSPLSATKGADIPTVASQLSTRLPPRAEHDANNQIVDVEAQLHRKAGQGEVEAVSLGNPASRTRARAAARGVLRRRIHRPVVRPVVARGLLSVEL